MARRPLQPPVPDPSVALAEVDRLFAEWPPVLVTVKPRGGRPRWHLLETREQFRELLAAVGTEPELRVSSVWDLVSVKGEVVVAAGARVPGGGRGE